VAIVNVVHAAIQNHRDEQDSSQDDQIHQEDERPREVLVVGGVLVVEVEPNEEVVATISVSQRRLPIGVIKGLRVVGVVDDKEVLLDSLVLAQEFGGEVLTLILVDLEVNLIVFFGFEKEGTLLLDALVHEQVDGLHVAEVVLSALEHHEVERLDAFAVFHHLALVQVNPDVNVHLRDIALQGLVTISEPGNSNLGIVALGDHKVLG